MIKKSGGSKVWSRWPVKQLSKDREEVNRALDELDGPRLSLRLSWIVSGKHVGDIIRT